MSRRRSLYAVLLVAIGSAIALSTVPSLRARFGAVLRAAHRRQITLMHRTPAALRVEVVRTYPHDPGAFTEGLLLDGPLLYESTGLNGQSTVRRVELQTGHVVSSVALSREFFGEGLAMASGQLIQLTWKEGIAFVYDARSLERRERIAYAGEGWGLCFNGRALVMSDGSDRLTFRDPESFAVQRTVGVTLQGLPLPRLNELECVGDSVYANIWRTDMIVRIDSATGRVLERIDASGLLTPEERRATDVLNGIAYDPADATFLITGKLWPKLFRVRFTPGTTASPGDTR